MKMFFFAIYNSLFILVMHFQSRIAFWIAKCIFELQNQTANWECQLRIEYDFEFLVKQTSIEDEYCQRTAWMGKKWNILKNVCLILRDFANFGVIELVKYPSCSVFNCKIEKKTTKLFNKPNFY